MKNIKSFLAIVAAISISATTSIAQHSLQLDDGAGHISQIASGNPGGTYLLPPNAGTLLVSSGGVSNSWLTTGNNGINGGTNFLGTINGQPLVIKTSNTEAARFLSNGNLAIGSPNATSRVEISETGTQGAFSSTTTGTERAGYFVVNNATSFSPALEATSNSSQGLAAVFRTTDAAAFAPTAVTIYAAAGIGLQSYGGGGGGWFLPGYPAGIFGSSGIGSGVQGSSNSGIGVVGGSSTGTGVYAQVRGVGNALIVEADNQGVSTQTTNNLAIFTTNVNPGVGQVARIDNTGRGFFNGGMQASGADVAETFSVEGDRNNYEPGDVLVISTTDDRTMTKCTSANSTRVAGVYATKPGLLLSSRSIIESQDDMVPMGVVGVIPTKVSSENGPIHRGDLLVTSKTPGHAMKAKPVKAGGVSFYPSGIIIGKALENFTDKGTGIIEVMVNVK